jgi:chemotaxis protein CheC
MTLGVQHLSETQTKAWEELVTAAVANSIAGLSTMVGTRVIATRLAARRVNIREVPDRLGGAESTSVGIVLAIENAPGHMALFLEPATAWGLIDILIGRPPQVVPPSAIDQLGELERSTLGEMGNIMGTFFLNTIADTTGYELRPTPPTVSLDMTGAILDVALAEVMMETDEIVLVEANFGTRNHQIAGTFIVMPSPAVLVEVMRSWGKE